MIEQSNFKKIRVYSRMIFGKTADLEVQLDNGKFLSSIRQGLINMANEGKNLFVAADTTLTEKDSNKTIVLNSASGAVVTLPPNATGLKFRFHVLTAPTSGSYTVVSDGSANNMYGAIGTAEVTAASDVAITAASDTLSFVQNQAVRGDSAEVEYDGFTGWIVRGFCNVAAGLTMTQAT